MNATPISAPDGLKGFDCNARVTPDVATLLKSRGLSFCGRYVRRGPFNPQDITEQEGNGILEAGLGLHLIQHVANEGWVPTPALGLSQAKIAWNEAEQAGYPKGGALTLDLEGVAVGTPASAIIGFVNNWYTEVKTSGLFNPVLYVGWRSGLTGSELYNNLRFDRYYSGYNLNSEDYPAIRGVCLKQSAYPGPHSPLAQGVPFPFDLDVTQTDTLGGQMTLAVGENWTQ